MSNKEMKFAKACQDGEFTLIKKLLKQPEDLKTLISDPNANLPQTLIALIYGKDFDLENTLCHPKIAHFIIEIINEVQHIEQLIDLVKAMGIGSDSMGDSEELSMLRWSENYYPAFFNDCNYEETPASKIVAEAVFDRIGQLAEASSQFHPLSVNQP